ncbi:MAG: flavodoxin domain-containing protein [Lachnospiraceae bacterium]|nr:flavodoxin domain-containing protein [Lachnospiraceae bacterium]MDD3617247.1 flavodoxin domain-containing protein [Lachnospiraceae bacterium]
MNRIVIYQSSTGFTKQYAEWIAEDLGCKAVSIKEIKQDAVKNYDQVIYGGWVMGGMVSGLDKVRQYNPKQLVVFAVGAAPQEAVHVEDVKTANKTGEIPVYYLAGGLRFDKLNFAMKGILKMVKKSVMKKENKTEMDEFMAKYLDQNFDHSDRKQIQRLVESL